MSLTASWLDALGETNALTATIESPDRAIANERTRMPFEEADPVRAFASCPGRRNFESKLWLASAQGHVSFESFWERALLATLDRADDVVGVSSQPAWMSIPAAATWTGTSPTRSANPSP